jgi:LPXTG-motif cell wall-anchored protein
MRPYALFGLPAAATVLALTGLTAPAHADTTVEPPVVAVVVPEQVAVIEGHTKTVTATLVNAGKVAAKDVVLTFGSTENPVDPGVGLGLPAGCDKGNCAVGDLAAGARKKFTFTLAPTAGSDLTSTFDVNVGGAGGLVGIGSPLTVVRAKGGVDIEVAGIDDMKLDRGQSKEVPIVVHNAGTEEVSGIAVSLFAQEGLEALGAFRNCDDASEAGIGLITCFFEQKLPAGSTFTMPSATPLKVRVAADAGGPFDYQAAVIAVGVTKDDLDSLARKPGPTLRLESLKTVAAGDEDDEDDGDDLNEDDNLALFTVAVGKAAADSAAVGGTFSGAVGDSATVEVGLRNLGPAATIPPGITWVQTVKVTIPTGIELSKVDENCLAGTDPSAGEFGEPGDISGRVYTCIVVRRVTKGGKATFSFTGTIAEGAHKAGSIVVDGGVQDTVKANDRAAITVKLTGGGEGGGLPVTGAPAAWLALGGAVLLLGGAAAFGLARRRRVITTTD